MAKKRDIYKIGTTKVPSVTQITGLLAKPALVPWAAKMAVEWIRENAEELEIGGYRVNDGHLEEAKNAHRSKKEEAGAFGSSIHSLVGAYVEGQLSMSDVHDPNDAKALENFIKATEGWKWLASETVVINHDLAYGGTADALAELPDGRVVIVDFKTSSGVYPEHSLQIAMYAYAEPVNVDLHTDWKRIEDGRILHFDKKRLTWESLERDVHSHYPFIPHFRKIYEWVSTFSDK